MTPWPADLPRILKTAWCARTFMGHYLTNYPGAWILEMKPYTLERSPPIHNVEHVYHRLHMCKPFPVITATLTQDEPRLTAKLNITGKTHGIVEFQDNGGFYLLELHELGKKNPIQEYNQRPEDLEGPLLDIWNRLITTNAV